MYREVTCKIVQNVLVYGGNVPISLRDESVLQVHNYAHSASTLCAEIYCKSYYLGCLPKREKVGRHSVAITVLCPISHYNTTCNNREGKSDE